MEINTSDLQRDEKGNGFHGEVASVDIVAHEEEVGIWNIPSNPKELEKITELAVHVAADGHRTRHGDGV